MAQTALRGNPVNTAGELPAVGEPAPAFTLTGADLGAISLEDFAGQRVVLNIFPSVDTPTCATSVRTFNARAAEMDNTKIINVSADLPFAQGRFCGAEGIENASTASTFRSPDFQEDYGVKVGEGVFAGLCARAVVVLDTDGTVLHSELVGEIADEPNYDAAITALS